MYKRCFFILLDGSRPDVIGKLLSEGRMPNFHKTFVEKGLFAKATSVFPSTTGPAYLPYLTGRYPGPCNIPGIRWFDRKEYHKKKFGFNRFRSYVGGEAYLFDRDISKDVLTLFEKFKSPVNIFSPISRGVGFWGNYGFFKKIYYALYARYSNNWMYVDRKLTGHAIRAIRKKTSDFIFLALPAVDEVSHHSHPLSKAVEKAYLQFDSLLGEMRDAFKNVNQLDDTLFVLGGDHGLSATHTHFDLVGFVEKQGYKTFYYPKIYKRDFDVAVMESGNAMAHIYFKNGKGWSERTPAHEMSALLEPLSGRPEISWVASLDHQGRVFIKSKDGEALLKEENGKIFYTPKGKDPLGFKKVPSVMTPDESFQFSFDKTYPDAFVQLIQLFKSDRTGDIVVNAQLGYDLRASYEYPEHTASHGSMHRDHMHVAVAFSHPIDTKRHLRSVDVFPTILKLLGIKQDDKPCDGMSLVA